MIVFCLTKEKYALDLSGRGASIFGYRWNSKGIKALYTASSRALAMAEVLVHLPMSFLPEGYRMQEIEIPDPTFIEEIDISSLDEGWNDFPHRPETKEVGDEFLRKNEHPVLKVPSALVKGDFNYLINPNHPDAKKITVIRVSDFPFDRRIFK